LLCTRVDHIISALTRLEQDMWTTTYRAETSAEPSSVWAALRALHSGIPLGPASDAFALDGPFEVGTTLTVTPQGQEPMTSEIIELEPGVVYADRTVFGDLALVFRHRIAHTTGGASVSHTLEISGEGADEIGPELGPQISGDFPVAMAELLAAAERRTHG
jgi:hypothetical protein